MAQVRVHNFAVSLDGFGTGEGQRLEAPFGHAEDRLMQWFFATRTFRAMQGEPGGDAGVELRRRRREPDRAGGWTTTSLPLPRLGCSPSGSGVARGGTFCTPASHSWRPACLRGHRP